MMPFRDRLAILFLLCSAGAPSRSAGAASHLDPEALRERGQSGVDALWAARPTSGDRASFNRMLDAVCAQHDCAASRLYWYTSLDKARAEAKATHKPILSLRLLGRLDEELSCANSRFFRTTLYSDPTVASYLRSHFVLHWESERPVPKITIDFGDGRQVKTTITGNSIHYVLDEEGRLVDALPGLYGARAFKAALEQSEAEARQTAAIQDEKAWRAHVTAYHRQRLTAVSDDWSQALRQAGTPDRPLPRLPNAQDWSMAAMEVATLKARVELPVLAQLEHHDPEAIAEFDKVLNDSIWWVLVQSEAARFELSPEVVRHLRESHLAADDTIILQQLPRSIAADTLRNEFLLRPRLDAWFVDARMPVDLQTFNGQVYANLFLMPRTDLSLGLYSETEFSGLPYGGLTTR